MAQTYYRRPYSLLWFFAIQLTLMIIYIILLTLGKHPHLAFLTITTVSINSILGTLFDPETCYKTKTTLDDGTVVRVKKPFIGLKSHEDLVGLTGGYEVRVDGWRYEKALIRI